MILLTSKLRLVGSLAISCIDIVAWGMLRVFPALLYVVISVLPVAAQEGGPYDLLIKNGRVLDGTGNPWYYADIAVSGEKIVWIGKSDSVKAREEVDAAGLYVVPGFIDVHSHAASGLESEERSRAEPQLSQGITTVVINPDGGGPARLDEQRKRLKEHGLGVNVAQMVPHGSIRREVVGMDDREPTTEELDAMRAMVREGMKEGAFGLSSGLFYTPAAYAKTEEVIELAKTAAEYNGVYSSHIRDESDYSIGLVASVEEVIEIARQAELPGIVTHIKALGTGVWGYSAPVVHRMDRARNEGVEVYADQYPYEASSTSLTAVLVPAWAREGGREAMLERFSDDAERDRIIDGMTENLQRRGGAARIQIAGFEADTSLEGQTLRQIAAITEQNAVEAAMNMIKEGNPQIISFNMNEEDIRRFMRQEWTMTGSDGSLPEFGKGAVHPRSYGAFPRKISTYVRTEQEITLAFAIRSMTGLPASVFGMKNRGVIREGAIADIAIFDLGKINDPATYEDPHRLSEGMMHVFVNGGWALKEGEFMPGMFGRVLKR